MAAPAGGIITFYRSFARELCSGVELRVIEGSGVRAKKSRGARKQDGIQIETLDYSRLVRWEEKFPAFDAAPGLRRYLAAAWAMWEQANYGADADIVEAVDLGLLFVPPAIEAKRPLVVQCHGSIGQIADHDPIVGEATENLLMRLIERDVLAGVSNVQTYSRANAAFWSAETGRNVTTIPPAWSLPDVFDPPQPGDRGLVVGRLQRWKGPEVLCEALRHFGGRGPCVDWIGRASSWGARHSSTAEHLARTYPDLWGTKFVHHAPISPTEVAHRQARALFNIVPSAWDVFNFTTVEAMASGRPIIVSTGAGASELIEDGVNGYLFSRGDPDFLAGAVDRVMSESHMRLTEIGQAAQETVRVQLDPQVVTSRRIAAYRAAIELFQSHPPSPTTGWLGDICRPAQPFPNDQMAFLNHMPLRSIVTHVVKRAATKLWRRSPGESVDTMRQRPTIAMLVPAFNAADYLPRLLEFAVQQAEPFDEIWVYDDCSTDDTAEIAKHYGANVVRGDVKRGCTCAKNILAARTEADWLHFHDADDELGPPFVALARRWTTKGSADVVLFPYEERDDATGKHMGYRMFEPNDVARDPRSYAIREQINPFCGLYRRVAFLRAGGYDEDPVVHYNEDVAMHIRLAFAGLTFAAEKEIAIINHRRSNSMSAANRLKCVQAQYQVMRKTIGAKVRGVTRPDWDAALAYC